MISQTISHYRTLSQLAGGGMGVVYEAEDLKLNRVLRLQSDRGQKALTFLSWCPLLGK